MQPFLFRHIWYDIPGVFCRYGSSNWFSRRVDEEFSSGRSWYWREFSINCLYSSVWARYWLSFFNYYIGTMPTIIQQRQKFLGVNNFYIPTVGIISTDISMVSMDFTNMNMNTGFFSWIISADISVLLKIYGYEYEYAKFSWILSMGSPICIYETQRM